MTTPEYPGGPGADFYIVELAGIVSQLVEEKRADQRWPRLAELVGVISTEWTTNPAKAAADANSLVTLAEVMKAQYPNESNVDIMLRYAQALAGIWESDILDEG